MCNCKKSSATVRAAAKQVAVSTSGLSVSARNTRRAPRKKETPVAAPEPLVEIEGETFADKCQTFAYMLGMDQPVSREVLETALEYPAYARSLLAARDNPEKLSELMYNSQLRSSSGQLNNFTNGKLVAKASSALMKWALSGFPTVSKATLEKRENACLACPNLVSPSSSLQRITASSAASDQVGRRTGNKSCAACGCVITNKIRLSTESCPVASDEDAALNRWGEEMKNSPQ